MIGPTILGMGAGLGALLLVAGLAGNLHDDRRADAAPSPSAPFSNASLVRAALAVGCAVLAFLATGWLVGATLVGVGVVTVPSVLGSRQNRAFAAERTEAIAAWAEMLRDTMAAASGLEEAIVSTAVVAPAPIRGEVQQLARRLERERLGPALRAFAAEVADPTADLVVGGLVLAGERPAGDLGALLGAVARTARDETTLILKVEAGRSRTRTAARVVTMTTLGFALLLVVLDRGFLRPYDTALGQVWLLGIGAVFALSFHRLEVLSRLPAPPRLLALSEER